MTSTAYKAVKDDLRSQNVGYAISGTPITYTVGATVTAVGRRPALPITDPENRYFGIIAVRSLDAALSMLRYDVRATRVVELTYDDADEMAMTDVDVPPVSFSRHWLSLKAAVVVADVTP